MSHSTKVQLERRKSYTVQAGRDLWGDIRTFFADRYSSRKAFIIIDERVNRLHGQKIEQECRQYFDECHRVTIPEGERSKSIAQWSKLQDQLLENGIERSTPIIAAGGGVTGDLAGFAAASVLRGVPLVHLPTSLLAMVDSSIGGKTGVNHPAGKNLVGAFYQPDAVFADIDFLETLERTEWIGGMAEMLKYAAIREPAMFDELEQAVDAGFSPSERWMNLIYQSAKIKIDIVQEDELESGKRAFLNFGHTFGHALEKQAGFGEISHGEAVFVGMWAAVHYSKALGAPIGGARFSPFKPLYPVTLPAKNEISTLIEEMQNDKKVKDGVIQLILLDEWGAPFIHACDDESHLQSAWQATLDAFNTET